MDGGTCELCGNTLVIRTARKGPNAGNQFWGCPSWATGGRHTARSMPGAAGTSSADAARNEPGRASKGSPVDPSVRSVQSRDRRKVAWRDGVRREGWKVRYVDGFARLRAWPEQVAETMRSTTPACWLAVQNLPSYEPAEDDVQRVLGMVRKIVRRGSAAPIPSSAENALLAAAALTTKERADRVSREPASPLRASQLMASVAARQPDQLDPLLALDSPEERQLLEALLAQAGGVGDRLIPQAPLDQLARSLGAETDGARRVDLLARTADGLVAVEVDGLQHQDAVAVDQDRDRLLSRAGVRVLRATADSVRQGQAPSLLTPTSSGDGHPLVDGPLAMDNLFLALVEGLARGFLMGERWSIDLVDDTGLALHGLPAYLSLLSAVDALWAGDVAPSVVSIRTSHGVRTWLREGLDWHEVDARPAPPDVRVVVDLRHSPLHRLPELDDVPTVVVRRAWLPVPLLAATSEPRQRIPTRLSQADVPDALRHLLREVFDKPDFRDGQLDAVMEVLSGGDCVVLLPTGGGKSLIYQLAGLLLPGRTLVVDPLVALMEDQQRSLAAQGVDRVVAISAFTTAAGRGEEQLAEVAAGDALFVLVSPERLQQQRFRDALRELAGQTPINLAVVDEAHCVSEWGHDFRTAYLNHGQVLRRTCRDGADVPPPILALTGTASRAVLRETLFELDITPRSANTIIKPRSFDRPELSYEVVRTTPAEAHATFAGLLRSLPARFGVPPEEFWAPTGERTFSGLVFAPHVNGDHGVIKLAERASTVLGEQVLPYSGSPPKGIDKNQWETRKRDNAAAWMSNQVPLLVSTKAFGMGIDKPNVRYVVHLGIPGSIESYYQEVGRAGRDRKPARCLLLFSEFNEQTSRQKLAEGIDLESVRLTASESSRQTADDIDRQLFFHLNSFHGVDAEMHVLERLLADVGDLGRPRAVAVPFARSDEPRERAIHRLVRLGVVQDYLVDWGGKRFDLVLADIDARSVVACFLAYVERSQPGRADAYREVIEQEAWEKVDDAVRGCARLLIAFVYDTVERARRRSLREMWLAAKESTDDAELRRRVLDYLSEGDVAPVLEQLAEAERFRVRDWFQPLADVVHPDEVRELRGSSGRLLVSYPDHPGLLMARSFSELADPEGDLREASAALGSALASASSRYQVPAADRIALLEWLLAACVTRGDADAAATVVATGRGSVPEWQPELPPSMHEHPAAAAINLESRLGKVLDQLRLVDRGVPLS